MLRILMRLELLESVTCELMNTHMYLMMFKGLKHEITYKVLTDKIRHRTDEPQTLDTLIELYENIPAFIKEQKNK
jgi:hypothetical protein